uniref:Uncharacterized protein n=1 Tax=Nelumbo nucifera TaxID=4432 RepID=A0A822XTU3_NELNU|nr:TPA_asm: hypothetical protein HUJ06_024616 [Nelumbo nucifera]
MHCRISHCFSFVLLYFGLLAVEGTDPVRRQKLIELLDIDLQWRMHKVSDGQRRRVQICMGLLHLFQVFSPSVVYSIGTR